MIEVTYGPTDVAHGPASGTGDRCDLHMHSGVNRDMTAPAISTPI